MIAPINKIFQQQRIKKNLLLLLAEMEKNLEIFYVMDQRQFITEGFVIRVWDEVKNEEVIKRNEPILIYAQALIEFNLLYKEYKEFEHWYSSDMKNKTPENAKKLHALKHKLDAQMKAMEAVIIPAGQALEKELLSLGMLKG